jgi:hypothetical protein
MTMDVLVPRTPQEALEMKAARPEAMPIPELAGLGMGQQHVMREGDA